MVGLALAWKPGCISRVITVFFPFRGRMLTLLGLIDAPIMTELQQFSCCHTLLIMLSELSEKWALGQNCTLPM